MIIWVLYTVIAITFITAFNMDIIIQYCVQNYRQMFMVSVEMLMNVETHLIVTCLFISKNTENRLVMYLFICTVSVTCFPHF